MVEEQAELIKYDNKFHVWRFRKYKELVGDKLKSTDYVLDAGCGEGDLLSGLGAGRKVGLDIGEGYLQRAKRKISDSLFIPPSRKTVAFQAADG